jgi:ABC-2 type transport system ATP-binding protein
MATTSPTTPTTPAKTSDVALRCKDLRKRYGDLEAVAGVSFEVGRGEVFGLLGPNGAGKTTTVEILEGIRDPDGGELEVLGLDPRQHGSQVKSRIGVQLQNAALYPYLTVAELIDLFGNFFPKRRPTDEVIAALDLGEKRNAQTRTLSGGQQQRLSVALALVNDPELVFLDEPTTGLDPAARRSLWEVIRQLRERGISILLTTHYMEEAEELCDRLAIMDHGKILDMGTVDELVGRRFRERAVHFRRMDGLSDQSLSGLAGVTRAVFEGDDATLYTTDVATTIGAVLAAADEVGVQPANLGVRRASLEDVFLDLTGRALRD